MEKEIVKKETVEVPKVADVVSYRFRYHDFLELSRRLEVHHSIFNKLWNLGFPIFTEKMPTACVAFDKLGECINFYINPKFWQTQNDTQREFIISHECLHVILYHGFRINKLKGNELMIANMALDVVVNHSLVNKFGFVRKEVDPENKYCWVDTLFKGQNIPDDKYFEYYYNLVKKECEKSGGKGKSEKGEGKGDPSDSSGMPQTVDDHEGLNSFNDPKFQEALKEALDAYDSDALNEFVEKQTEDIKETCKQAGCDPGKVFYVVDLKKVIPKRKWETVVKRWASRYIVDKTIEQWAVKNRRFSFVGGQFFIPSDKEVDEYDKHRIKVWFFQDTSGSCSHLADRFFKAAMSLPKDRFDVKMHCFDTQVYETDLVSKKLYGFGGTTFTCIEDYIQKKIKETDKSYPLAVWVITDGYGNNVSPEKPANWQWFLSEDYKACIPTESKTHMLKDFE